MESVERLLTAPLSLDERESPNTSPFYRSMQGTCVYFLMFAVFEQELCSCVVMLGTILLIILILILIGALPTWSYSGGWGYYPSGGFGLLVVIVVILLLMERI